MTYIKEQVITERSSIVTLSNSSASTTNLRNPFESSEYSSFTEGTDWRRMSPDTGITFSSTTGRMTVSKDGTYQVQCCLIIGELGNLDHRSRLKIYQNSNIVINSYPGDLMDGDHDPWEQSVLTVITASAGDYFEIEHDNDQARTKTYISGSTFSVMKL